MSVFLNWKVWLFGLLSWLIPFLVSFFDSSGTIVIADTLFKSLMVVIGGASGVALLVLTFRQLEPTVVSGLLIGTLWLGINLVMDLLILVPMSGTGVADYVYDIGLRYLLIPIIAAGFGLVAQAK